MDDMSHVRVLWLGRGTVCRHVEVARDLGERCEFQESRGLPPRWGQVFTQESDRSGSGFQRGLSHGTLEDLLPFSEPQVARL